MLGALVLSAFDSVVLSAPISGTPDPSSPTSSTNGFSDFVNNRQVGQYGASPSAALGTASQGAGTSQNQVTKRYVSQGSPLSHAAGAPRSASTKPPQYPTTTAGKPSAQTPPSGISAVQHLI